MLEKSLLCRLIGANKEVNLIIDQGNSVCKVAVYGAGKQQMSTCVSDLNESILREISLRYTDIRALIYSSVSSRPCPDFGAYFTALEQIVILAADTPVPVEVAYDRSSLGSDRLAAVVGAYHLTRGERPALVIDAGTAVTYEYIAVGGRYLGGNIAPGLWLRLKALNSFTSRLPLIDELPEARVEAYGRETRSAMLSGCLLGLEREVAGYIEDMRRRHPEAYIYMTGGDAPLLAERLEAYQVQVVPELVLLGLNEILEYNKI